MTENSRMTSETDYLNKFPTMISGVRPSLSGLGRLGFDSYYREIETSYHSRGSSSCSQWRCGRGISSADTGAVQSGSSRSVDCHLPRISDHILVMSTIHIDST